MTGPMYVYVFDVFGIMPPEPGYPPLKVRIATFGTKARAVEMARSYVNPAPYTQVTVESRHIDSVLFEQMGY